MTSLPARLGNAVKAAYLELVPQQKSAQKFYGYGMGGDASYFAASSSQRMGRDKYSAARAYLTVAHVHTAIRLILSAFENVPWIISEYSVGEAGKQEGTPIAEKGDIVPRHPLQKVLRNYKQYHSMALLQRVCASMLLHDETYIELLRVNDKMPPGDRNKVTGLEWLNPIGISKQTSMGRIAAFHYSGTDGDPAQILQPYEVAYEHGFNSMSDLNGYSNVQALMDELNIGVEYRHAILNYLVNGLHMGGIIAPAPGELGAGPKLKELQDLLNNQAKGVRNIGRWHVMHNNAQVTDFGMPEFDKLFAPMSSDIRTEVFAKFSIPEAAVGIVDSASFKSGDEVTYRFYQAAVIPYASRIAEFINVQLMPYFAEGDNHRLEYDTSEWDRASEADKLEAEVAKTRSEIIPIEYNEIRQQLQLSPLDKFKNMWIVPGIEGLVPESELDKVWKYRFLVAPSVFNSQELTGKPLPQPVDPTEVVPTPDGAKPPVTVTEADVEAESEEPLANDTKAHACTDACDHDHAIPPAVKAQLDELEAWRKVAFKTGADEPGRFGYSKLTDYTADYIKAQLALCAGDKDRMYDVFAQASDEVSMLAVYDEALGKSAADYRRSVRGLSRGLWSGSLDRRAFIGDMTTAIQRSFTDAFTRGLKAEGLSFDETTPEERDILQERVNGELIHLGPLADDIIAASKSEGGNLKDVRDRIDRWVSRYDSVYDVGVLVGARDKKKKWNTDPAKESCRDCLRLNGKVYRASTWLKAGIVPRSADLACFGTHCGCGFEDTDDPVTQGKPPALRGPG